MILWAFLRSSSLSFNNDETYMVPEDVTYVLKEMNLGISRTSAILRSIGLNYKQVGKIINNLVITTTSSSLSLLREEHQEIDKSLVDYSLYLRNLKLHDGNLEAYTFLLGEFSVTHDQLLILLLRAVRLKSFSDYALVCRNLGIPRCPVKLAHFAKGLLDNSPLVRPFSSSLSSPHSSIHSISSFIRNIEFPLARDEAMFLIHYLSLENGFNKVSGEGDEKLFALTSILLATLHHNTMLESDRVALIIKEICRLTSTSPFSSGVSLILRDLFIFSVCNWKLGRPKEIHVCSRGCLSSP